MLKDWRTIKVSTYLLFILTLLVVASIVIEYKDAL